jgi:hypothetical protein
MSTGGLPFEGGDVLGQDYLIEILKRLAQQVEEGEVVIEDLHIYKECKEGEPEGQFKTYELTGFTDWSFRTRTKLTE